MEREQVIKALECCSKWVCDECPNKDESPCTQATATDALSLIKELTEEKERMKAKILEINGNLCGLLPFIDQIAKEMLEGSNG